MKDNQHNVNEDIIYDKGKINEKIPDELNKDLKELIFHRIALLKLLFLGT